MVTTKRILGIMLSAVLALTLLASTACTAQQNSATNGLQPTVTDAFGTVLTIPDASKDVRISSVYAVSVPFIVALGLDEKVVAINFKSSFWSDNLPALAAAGTAGRGTVDLEKLASYEPTVLIHRSNDPATLESVEKLNIPTLCISAEDYEGVISTIDLLGAYFSVEQRASEVKNYLNSKLEKIDRIVASIPKQERVSAMVFGGQIGRVAGGDMLQTWMVERAGGVPVAAGIKNNKNWAEIGVEEIFRLNPDYVFLTSSAVLEYTPEQLFADSAWAEIKAVQQRHIYNIPAQIDSWDMPGITIGIGTFYLLHQMYPQYFSAQDLQAEIDEYYQFMFNKTFEPSYLGYSLG